MALDMPIWCYTDCMQREFSLRPILINHQPLPGKMAWVKIFTYEPAEEEVVATRGKMYAVLSVSTKVEVDFTPIMQLILEDIQKEYFEKTEGGILQALERTLDGIHKKLILMAQQDKRLRGGFSFNLLTAVNWGTVLYFGQLGASRAALVRHGTLYDIDEGTQKTTGLYLSSGTLDAGDRIVLATEELFGAADRQTLTSDLLLPEEQIGQAIEGRLGQGAERLKQSGMVLMVDIKQVPTIEEEGLHIEDVQATSDPNRSGQAQRYAARIRAFGARVKGQGVKLWQWKIGGKTPVLPLILVGLAVIILVGSIFWPKSEQPSAADLTSLNGILAEITSKQDEAESIAEVNADRSLDMLDSSADLIGQAEELAGQNEQVIAAIERQELLEDKVLSRSVLQTTKLASLQINPTQSKLIMDGETVYAVDSQEQRLVMVNGQGKVQKLQSSNRYDRGALLAMTSDGLVLVSGGQSFVVRGDGGLSSGTVLAASLQAESLTGYKSTGYLLDRTGQVYRLPVQGEKIGTVSTYFNQVLSGTNFVDIAVDGSVYVVQDDGTMEVYLNGARQNVTWERSSLLKNPKALMSSDKTDTLLVWQDEAILVWTKAGKYVGQYRLADNGTIQMVGIDVEAKRLYILSEGNLLRADL